MAALILLDALKCTLLLMLHFAVLAGGVLLLNKKVGGMKSEIYRKLFHLVSVFSIMPIIVPSSSWISSIIVCLLFMGTAYIASTKSALEDKVGMKQRSSGEQLRSMFILYGTYSLVTLIGWGIFGNKWIVILSVIAWGIGDAVAALVGKRFGKHKVSGAWIEGTKSIEGTVGMFLATFISVFILYNRHTSLSNVGFVVLVCFWIAVFSSITELFSKKGLDTAACPIISMLGFVVVTLAAGAI